MSDVTLRFAVPADADRCFEVEQAAFEYGPEAATLERIQIRIGRYPEGFLLLEHQGQIIGFINSGCALNVVLSDDNFKALIGHDPSAPNVVITSFVIDPAYQGRGYAKVLMQAFVDHMQQLGKRSFHLFCKEHHVGFYEKLGYQYLGPSASNHGGVPWHDMKMDV